MADPELPLLIRSLRERAGLSQKDLAGKVGCSATLIWTIEGGGGGKVPLPSPDVLRKIAKACALEPMQERTFCLQLLLGRARQVVPEEVRPYLNDRLLSPMPEAFLARLKKDVARMNAEARERIDKEAGLGGRLESVLAGVGQLDRHDVAKLAVVLKHSATGYLMDAGFLSEGVRLVVEDFPGCVAMLEVVGQLRPETRNEIRRFQLALGGLEGKREAVKSRPQ